MGDAQFSGSDEGDRLRVKLWRLIRTTAVISTVVWGEKDYHDMVFILILVRNRRQIIFILDEGFHTYLPNGVLTDIYKSQIIPL